MTDPRQPYSKQFKDEPAALVIGQGYSYGKAAKELDIPEKTLANWVRDRRRGPLQRRVS